MQQRRGTRDPLAWVWGPACLGLHDLPQEVCDPVFPHVASRGTDLKTCASDQAEHAPRGPLRVSQPTRGAFRPGDLRPSRPAAVPSLRPRGCDGHGRTGCARSALERRRVPSAQRQRAALRPGRAETLTPARPRGRQRWAGNVPVRTAGIASPGGKRPGVPEQRARSGRGKSHGTRSRARLRVGG